MRATLKNNITFDGPKSGDKIQENDKCFEPNTSYNRGKVEENTELLLRAQIVVHI